MTRDLEARRAHQADRLAGLRARATSRLARLRAKRPKPAPERGQRWPWLLLLLGLLCAGPVTLPVEVAPVPCPACDGAATAGDAPAPKPADVPRIRKVKRPAAPDTTPPRSPWLDALRLQVSARSPRLALCFDGSENPGQIKWTTTVEPVRGTVSEHELAPMLNTAPVTAAQRECLLEVLRSPAYKLPTASAPDAPTRVGLVIEF